MALLDGQIRNAIAAGFKGRLLKGTLTRTIPSTETDDYGDPVGTTTTAYPCEGFVESFSAYYRAQAGIPDTDVKILLIAGLINTVPTKDDRVTFRGTTYQIRKTADVDPAGASYTLQGYQP